MIIIHVNLDNYKNVEIVLLIIGRLCWGCIFALISIITVIIYPTMIRTKGLGWNRSLGFIGSIIGNSLIEFKKIKEVIFVFFGFIFFSLTLSYGLRKQIGTFILESPSVNENKKEKEFDNETEINDDDNISNNNRNYCNRSKSVVIE